MYLLRKCVCEFCWSYAKCMARTVMQLGWNHENENAPIKYTYVLFHSYCFIFYILRICAISANYSWYMVGKSSLIHSNVHANSCADSFICVISVCRIHNNYNFFQWKFRFPSWMNEWKTTKWKKCKRNTGFPLFTRPWSPRWQSIFNWNLHGFSSNNNNRSDNNK